MPEDVNAALTRDEWAAILDAAKHGEQLPAILADYVEEPHRLAAIALHGHPFGFTWADYDAAGRAAHAFTARAAGAQDQVEARQLRDVADRLHELARRIAALLPPQTQ